jgi:hypothetical protein
LFLVLLRVGQSTFSLKKYFLQLGLHYLSMLSPLASLPTQQTLPTKVGSNQSRLPIAPRQPFKWAIINIVVSCLFLGIPYIFFERHGTRLSSRIIMIDEGSGLRYATPILVIGACTCLVVSTINPPFLPPLLQTDLLCRRS